MSATDHNKDKGKSTQGQQNQQGQKQNQDPTSHMGESVRWQPGQKQVSTDKEQKTGTSAQNQQGNMQQGQGKYQGYQGKIKTGNKDINKDNTSEY